MNPNFYFRHSILLVLFFGIPSIACAQTPIEAVLEIPGSATQTFVAGELIPMLVSIRNVSTAPVCVLPPLDGSTLRLRHPRYECLEQKPVNLPGYFAEGICGVVNPLRVEDFITLQPGESTPTYSFSYKPWMAGIYQLAYQVLFNANIVEFRGISDGSPVSPTMQTLYDQIPKVDIVSNWVKVNVVSNGNTLDPVYHCLMGMPKTELDKIFYYYFPTQNSRIVELPTNTIHVAVHFDSHETIDGVELKLREYIDFNLSEDHFLWMRGGIQSIPQQIEYKDNTIYALRVGYFADPSDIETPVFQSYR